MTPAWQEDGAARAVYESVRRFAHARLADRVLAWDDAPEEVPEDLGLEALGITIGRAGAGEVPPLGLVAAGLVALAEVDAGIALRLLARQLAAVASERLARGERTALGLAGSAGLLAVGGSSSGLVVVLDDGRIVQGRTMEGAGPGAALGCRTAPLEWCTADGLDGGPVLDAAARSRLCMHFELGLAAIACGVAGAAVDAAAHYADERYQGGVMIAQHPAVAALLAASRRRRDAAGTALAAAVAGGDAPVVHLALTAALAAAEANASDCVQVHGGYGYMHEYGAEKRLRDAKTLAVLPRAGFDAG